MAGPDPVAPTSTKARASLASFATRWEVLLLFLFVVVILVNSNISPDFLNLGNILDASFNFMEKAIIAMPMIFVIILGDIDISVASTMALSSTFMGMAATGGAHTPLLCLIGVGVGAAAGFLNGVIITRFAIPSIAVTIGSLSLYRGISYVILGDQAYTDYPKRFAFLGQGYIGSTGIPFELALFAVFAVVFGVLLRRTAFGRKAYAIGSNSTTARFSGVNVSRIRLIVFTLTGMCSGVAAILLTSRIGSTRPNIASGWELDVITTVVLGGVAITGGKGNIWGVVIAIFLIGFLNFGMGLVNIPGPVMSIVTGFMLIIAILVPELLDRARSRAAVSREGRR